MNRITLQQRLDQKRAELKLTKANWFKMSVMDTSPRAMHLTVRMTILENEISQIKRATML